MTKLTWEEYKERYRTSRQEAKGRYEAKNYVKILTRLRQDTDADIVTILDSCPNKNAAVKMALREFFKRYRIDDMMSQEELEKFWYTILGDAAYYDKKGASNYPREP